ncbi:MAG: metal ABC transporter permease [Chloroflexi bacterium]|nr:metal ABC transporter permease [Chloroflexota bacterium]MCC6893276.1 metal ABC transporter permease [Anaerolineae bacterium]
MNLDALVQWFAEPLQYDFMVKALAMSAVVGLVCAVLSCYMILKGWSLMGDAVSHSVMPGVVFSYILGIPFSIGAFVFGLISVILIGFVKRQTRLKEDAVIGLIFTAFFALGLIMISRTPSTVDLTHILFGNVLGITNSDMIQTVVIAAITMVAILALRKDLMLFCFDENHARAIGLNTTFLYYALLSLLALTIVAALQTVGIILVIAMLITPGAIAYLLTDRFNRMMIIASVVSVLSCLIGAYASYHLDASTGGCIVVLQAIIFGFVFVFAPKQGLLRRMQLARHERQLAIAGLEGSAHGSH